MCYSEKPKDSKRQFGLFAIHPMKVEKNFMTERIKGYLRKKTMKDWQN
jgi:hypothetical protein